jgi:nucleotide-binding universal stress UspA family protein
MFTILCPVDFSAMAEREIHMAAGLAKRLGAQIVVEHCISESPPPGLGVSWMFAEEHERERKKEAARTREILGRLFRQLPVDTNPAGIVGYGSLDRMVLEAAAALPADLIVMATHGRSTTDHHSATERVILDAPCAVLTTREQGPEARLPDFLAETPIRTLVPVNLSEQSHRALDYAVALSQRLPLALDVLYVDEGGEKDRERVEYELHKRLSSGPAARVPIEIVAGPPVESILRREAEIDARLIVTATHHEGWIARLFHDSTARQVLHASPCPVWYVPDHARSFNDRSSKGQRSDRTRSRT